MDNIVVIDGKQINLGKPADKAWRIVSMIDAGETRSWIREAVKILAEQLDKMEATDD